MKKFLATICIVGSAFALSACETGGAGFVDTGPPYTQERTAGAKQEMSAAPVQYRPAERTFNRAQSK